MKHNNNNTTIAVLIATSKNRTKLLLERALKSVYDQKNVNPLVIIVDDNSRNSGESTSKELSKIRKGVESLRTEYLMNKYKSLLHIERDTIAFKDYFKTIILSNKRTQGNSGTGAWNTGIYYLSNNYPMKRIYVAILDDDDEFMPTYLSHCNSLIDPSVIAVFVSIIWIDKNTVRNHYVYREKLTQEAFLIGNPGVQGSNMFIRLDIFHALGGFDECLPSTTDRDLMIRLLDYNDLNKINSSGKIVTSLELLVKHYADGLDRLTDNKIHKTKGLDIFYEKYSSRFSADQLQKSLARAKKFFNYTPINERMIVIGMALKNSKSTLKDAINSLLIQKNVKRHIILIIADDASTDNWQEEIGNIIHDHRIRIVSVNFGKVFAIRNFILDYIRHEFPNADLIGRLDADDILTDEYCLSKIEEVLDTDTPDVIIAGNKLSYNNQILPRINKSDKRLLDFDYLGSRLYRMSMCDKNAELPSCNVFIVPSLDVYYPEVDSAEDHWLTVNLILQKKNIKIICATNILYITYSLSGDVTKINRESNKYVISRKELYTYFMNNKY